MKHLLRKVVKSSKLFLVLALCFLVIGMTLVIPVNAFEGEISNGALTLKVQDEPAKSAYASFILTKSNESVSDTLTYSQFYSSYTTISINGMEYRYSEGEVIKQTYMEEDGSVISVQNFGGVEVTQKLMFVTGNSSKKDMLLIGYHIENKTDNDVLTSVRVVIDPTLSKAETDMVQVEGKSYNTETTFTGAEVADTWCIKDVNDNIAAYGVLNTGATMPDKFQIADWKNLYDTKADYVTSRDTVIEDNAVAVIWENRQLGQGEILEFATQYGLYSEDEVPTTVEPTTTDGQTTEPVAAETTTVEQNTTEPAAVESPTDEESQSENEDKETTTESNKTLLDVNEDIYSPKTGYSSKISVAIIMFVASAICMAMFIYSESKERRVKS